MRFLAQSSRSTPNSIFSQQNAPFLLQCQAAQSNEYSHAKQITHREFILTLVYAMISIVAALFDIELLSAISGLLAVIVILFNKYSDKKIGDLKKTAAHIQQYIDITLFSSISGNDMSDWGYVQKKSDLASMVSAYSICDTAPFNDWYSDYSSLNPESQIFYCQCENIRWSNNLLKKFIWFLRILMCGISLILICILIFINPTFTKALYILSWFIPIVEHFLLVHNDVNDSIVLLGEINIDRQRIEARLNSNKYDQIIVDLIGLQHKIQNMREHSYLIPDWFYKHHKQNHQQQEDAIAQTIQTLDQ